MDNWTKEDIKVGVWVTPFHYGYIGWKTKHTYMIGYIPSSEPKRYVLINIMDGFVSKCRTKEELTGFLNEREYVKLSLFKLLRLIFFCYRKK